MENPPSSPKTAWFPTVPRLCRWLFNWRTLRRGLVTVTVVVTAIAVFYAEENWRGKHAWQKYRREGEAKGVKFGPETFIPPKVPDEQNFAMTPLLAPLFDFEPGTQKQRDTNGLMRLEIVGNRLKLYQAISTTCTRSNTWVLGPAELPIWYRDFLQTNEPATNAGKNLDLASVTTPELATRILAVLSVADTNLNELRAAAKRPLSRFNIRYENDDPTAILLPHLGSLARYCRILQIRASAELTLGRTDEAFNDIELMLRFMQAVREEPVLISQLVRFAELTKALQPIAQGLAAHQWSAAQLQALQQRLEALDLITDVAQAMDAERAFLVGRMFEYVRSLSSKERAHYFDEISSFQHSSFGRSSWMVLYVWAAPSGWFFFEQMNYDRACRDRVLPTTDVRQHRVSPERSKQVTGWDAQQREISPIKACLHHEAFVQTFLPAITGVLQKTACAQTAADAGAIACALERYRLANGKLPDSLAALSPQFKKDIPHDVITGEPLKYSLTGNDSFLLYSVGWNEKDDGGTVVDHKENGPDPEQGDWVWRNK